MRPIFHTFLVAISFLILGSLFGCSEAAVEEPYQKENYDKYQVNVKSTLNIRKLPKQNSPKIGALQNGEIVNVVDINDGWAEIITADNRKGFISSKYITLVEKRNFSSDENPNNASSKKESSFTQLLKAALPDGITWSGFFIILAIVIITLIIATKIENDFWAFILAIPAQLFTGVLGTGLAFGADLIVRALDFLNPLTWILYFISTNVDEYSFWAFVIAIASDWMSLAFFAGILFFTIIFIYGILLTNLSDKLRALGCLLAVPIVIMGMCIHYDTTSDMDMMYGPTSQVLMYIIGGLTCLVGIVYPWTMDD